MAAQRRSRTATDELWDDFHSCVNLNSEQLRDWLLTESSGEEAFGARDLSLPDPGRAVLAVLGKRRGDLTETDRQVMADTVATIRDLLDRRPPAGSADDRWRRALLDLGHDPLRAERQS
ncbi:MULTISPECIES: DUF3140 domain-containing protein [unclassified Solwaraspora]|uniref:DUF3140 domain-containing protein n=1 Tax=unclassified Solwaraspora TaxID=2627926 RepID=UPI00259BEF6E|nr:DUF3140 domain-containing protein [Solwaraspora sp. WMMA2056]WJK44038.1 DUF3140 domain-containing protein [Solwaraspora sp. WMMA2056]